MLLQEPSVRPERTGIAAKINGEVVTWDEIEVRLRGYKPEERTEDLRRSELRKLAEERLFLQFAKEYKVVVSEQDVDEAIKKEKKQLGGDDRFEDYLRMFRKMTFAEYREDRRRVLMISTLYRRLSNEAFRAPKFRSVLLYEHVTPDELRDYYRSNPDQFKGINHITVWRIGLTCSNEEERALRRKLAESLLRKIEDGTDFFVLAHHYSEVLTTEAGGRKLPGYRELKREESPFSEETTKYLFDELKEGEVSRVVEDKNTINIFKLDQRVERKEETFEQAQLKIRATLENRKREENRVLLRAELVKQSFIEPADLFK